jgi:hypothetical protein
VSRLQSNFGRVREVESLINSAEHAGPVLREVRFCTVAFSVGRFGPAVCFEFDIPVGVDVRGGAHVLPHGRLAVGLLLPHPRVHLPRAGARVAGLRSSSTDPASSASDLPRLVSPGVGPPLAMAVRPGPARRCIRLLSPRLPPDPGRPPLDPIVGCLSGDGIASAVSVPAPPLPALPELCGLLSTVGGPAPRPGRSRPGTP